jgi:hypothetical protein
MPSPISAVSKLHGFRYFAIATETRLSQEERVVVWSFLASALPSTTGFLLYLFQSYHPSIPAHISLLLSRWESGKAESQG